VVQRLARNQAFPVAGVDAVRANAKPI